MVMNNDDCDDCGANPQRTSSKRTIVIPTSLLIHLRSPISGLCCDRARYEGLELLAGWIYSREMYDASKWGVRDPGPILIYSISFLSFSSNTTTDWKENLFNDNVSRFVANSERGLFYSGEWILVEFDIIFEWFLPQLLGHSRHVCVLPR